MSGDENEGRAATETEESAGAEAAAETPADASPEADSAEERGLETADAPDPLEELREQVAQLEDQLLRRRAEFDNYRRRVERERSQASEDAVGELLTELLPIFDNLERAARAEGDEGSVRAGVELILRGLAGVLAARGVATEEPLGQHFDPARHQALVHEPVPGREEGTIVEVFQKGYLLGSRLLRPALVKVAKGGDAEPASGGPEVGGRDDGETLQ